MALVATAVGPDHFVGAAFEGLKAMRSPEQVAKIRGKSVDEIIG